MFSSIAEGTLETALKPNSNHSPNARRPSLSPLLTIDAENFPNPTDGVRKKSLNLLFFKSFHQLPAASISPKLQRVDGSEIVLGSPLTRRRTLQKQVGHFLISLAISKFLRQKSTQQLLVEPPSSGVTATEAFSARHGNSNQGNWSRTPSPREIPAEAFNPSFFSVNNFAEIPRPVALCFPSETSDTFN